MQLWRETLASSRKSLATQVHTSSDDSRGRIEPEIYLKNQDFLRFLYIFTTRTDLDLLDELNLDIGELIVRFFKVILKSSFFRRSFVVAEGHSRHD